VVSNTYCVVFLFCFSSCCVPCVASFSPFFSGLSVFSTGRLLVHYHPPGSQCFYTDMVLRFIYYWNLKLIYDVIYIRAMVRLP